jgi:hypothetical protein
MMLKASAEMNILSKIILLKILLLTTLQVCFATEPTHHELDKNTKYQDVVKTNEAGEIIISTGPDIEYFSSQFSETKHEIFCKSNRAIITVTRRIQDSNKENITIFNISGELNGKKIDIFQGKGQSKEIDNFNAIDVDTRCIENNFTFFLIGYSASITQSGSTILSVKIDASTGEIL